MNITVQLIFRNTIQLFQLPNKFYINWTEIYDLTLEFSLATDIQLQFSDE